ncbi:MAG: hypothetical protein KAG86_01000, partial [Gammaproteobacteria bacterium]|nr:hypothetical protein [Gammaproteobacteria bacterium]
MAWYELAVENGIYSYWDNFDNNKWQGGEPGIRIRLLFHLLKIPFKQGQDSIPVPFCRSPVIF